MKNVTIAFQIAHLLDDHPNSTVDFIAERVNQTKGKTLRVLQKDMFHLVDRTLNVVGQKEVTFSLKKDPA